MEGGEGAAALAELESIHRAQYPHLLQECDGIARGSGRELGEIMVLNFIQELAGLVSGEAGVPPQELGSTVGGEAAVPDQLVYPDACTDVHLLDAESGVSMWGHNEDGDATLGYVLEMKMVGEEGTSYTGLCYAGCLCGWAWAYNEHGIVTTINALTPSKACGKGNDRCWHGRVDQCPPYSPLPALFPCPLTSHRLFRFRTGPGSDICFTRRPGGERT